MGASKDVDQMHVRSAPTGFERALTTVSEYDSHALTLPSADHSDTDNSDTDRCAA